MPRTIRPPDLALYSMLSDPSMSPDGKKVAVSVRKANLTTNSSQRSERLLA